MKYCARCLYPENHPLYLVFDEKGVCSGCRIHEEKDILDWNARGKKLDKILNSYRNTSGNNYDCIIPVSGARDSYFIVHTIKKVYGMNPLLVTYNKQYNTDTGIRNLANLRKQFDVDIMTLTVNPESVKRLTKASLRKMGSIYWHCLAGQTVYPVQVAVKFKIPLIVWGAHQGVDQVGMFSHLDEVEMTRKYRKEHDLMGFEAEDMIDEFDNVTYSDVQPFLYPDDKEIERVGIRGIYLNNYIRWDSRLQHEEMIKAYGYETRKQHRTFDSYNDADCYVYSDIHDYLKFIKHGYTKIVDHASREIRLGHLTREEGAVLVEQHYNKPLQNLSLFLEWLGITESGFNFLVDQHRNKNFWFRNDNWEWELKSNFIELMKKAHKPELDIPSSLKFVPFKEVPEGISTDKKNKYILIGKGVS